MLAYLSHLSIGLLGLVSVYAALLLTETAEGKLQNRLEVLWVQVDDLSKAALSRQAAFLQQVSRLLGAAFDRLLGDKLFSAKAVATSICFSSAATCFAILIIRPEVEGDQLPALPVLVIAVVLIVIGFSPVPFRYGGFVWAVMVLGLGVYMDRSFATWDIKWIAEEVLPAIPMLIGAIGSDIFFIAASRWYLRRGENMSSSLKSFSLLAFGTCLGFLLVSPVVARVVIGNRPFSDPNSVASRIMNLATIIGVSNIITAMIPLAFVVLSLVALAHLVLWPLLQAPIYAAQRRGLIRQPKLLGTFGVTCLVFAWPNSPFKSVYSSRHETATYGVTCFARSWFYASGPAFQMDCSSLPITECRCLVLAFCLQGRAAM